MASRWMSTVPKQTGGDGSPKGLSSNTPSESHHLGEVANPIRATMTLPDGLGAWGGKVMRLIRAL